MLKAGMYLPVGVGVTPEVVFVDNHEDISRELGDALFDVVVTNLGHDKSQFVGFVRDEFMFDGSEFNYLATALFRRDIRGGCVVLWGVNPDDGLIDGDTYDLPEKAMEFIIEDLTEFTAQNYNASVISTIMVDVAQNMGLVSEEWLKELEENLTAYNPESAKRVNEMMNELARRFEADPDAQAVLAGVVIQEQINHLDNENNEGE